jgi:hypothetical protein
MKKHFNTYFMNISRFLSISFLVGFLLGCSITKETIYGDIPVPNLSDEQLLQEMESIYLSLGQKFNKAAFLMAIMPDPAYVLTSSYTTFSGVYSVNMASYTMPRGYRTYGSGTFFGSGITQYQYTDANATIRAIILIAQLVNESKIRQLQERGYSIVVEFRRRVEEKWRKMEMAIEQFFVMNPDLRERKTLLAAILPWVASEKTFKSDNEMLEYAANIVRELRTSKNYTWFGTFSQIDRLPDGTTVAGSNYIKVNTRIVGNVLTGRGILGSGEVVSLQANIKDGKWRGVVTNETMGVSFECQGTITDTEFTASYWGSAWGRYLQGTVVLLTEKKGIYSYDEIIEWYNNAVKKREWKKISESGNTTYCYDTRNISYPSKGVVRVYTIVYYESKKAINDKINQYQQLGLSTKGYENLYGTVSLQEVNCSNKMYLPIFFMDYDKNRNSLNQSWDLSINGWSKIPSTMPTFEELFKVVCP